MIKIESSPFATLVRNYKKLLKMRPFCSIFVRKTMRHFPCCRMRRGELIDLNPTEIERRRLNGRMCFVEEEKKQDIIRLWI